MSLIQIAADVLGLIGLPQADHDRSIVEESLQERHIRHFWKAVVIVLVVAFVAIGLYSRFWKAQARTSAAPATALGVSTTPPKIPAGHDTPAI